MRPLRSPDRQRTSNRRASEGAADDRWHGSRWHLGERRDWRASRSSHEPSRSERGRGCPPCRSCRRSCVPRSSSRSHHPSFRGRRSEECGDHSFAPVGGASRGNGLRLPRSDGRKWQQSGRIPVQRDVHPRPTSLQRTNSGDQLSPSGSGAQACHCPRGSCARLDAPRRVDRTFFTESVRDSNNPAGLAGSPRWSFGPESRAHSRADKAGIRRSCRLRRKLRGQRVLRRRGPPLGLRRSPNPLGSDGRARCWPGLPRADPAEAGRPAPGARRQP